MHTSSSLMLTGLLAAALAGCSAGSPPSSTQTAKPAQAQPAGLRPDARPLATGTGTGTDASVTGPLPRPARTPPPAAAADPTLAAQTVAWRCGPRMVATRFDAATDALQLTLEGRRLVLLSAQAASGARFADAQGNQFWEHAGEATLSLAGGEAIRCVHETAITIG
ncbi:MliC family protein [Xanthomonas phaseoli]|uniref:C-type lysozyme inhibitor domain-containing protein n=1 Tax=Xanthomonas phaseoli pv. dieffenbachiae TaxID=92828 RepID=A0A1V9H8J8_9XANT|nr:MliC family protein [Xanthomonas phaseoli]MBO9787483.1 MliC family protein [Xanthomonas phaseoli pv. dieffenbachiae]MBO9886521.1 MliC family protein [Xanthomonas phaseoli pv. dieffenbachiae]MBO9914727.1 MliC family protein [Xanthomonas phaseoli pv. dieffenbachiae]MBO9937308.1 MliC family protein [Xanthomonas phaseoli pv. dieffenbachiae]MBO9994933.1 MliC family protein [Xanthomonas phaseoli pv. dieffenbachiae]